MQFVHSGDAPLDLALIGGSVVTMDPARRTAAAVGIRDGRIVLVGASADVDALVGPGTRRIELEGRTVMPSFQDAHAHPSMAGIGLLRCPLHERAAHSGRVSPGHRHVCARSPGRASGCSATAGTWRHSRAARRPAGTSIASSPTVRHSSSTATGTGRGSTAAPSSSPVSTATRPTRLTAASNGSPTGHPAGHSTRERWSGSSRWCRSRRGRNGPEASSSRRPTCCALASRRGRTPGSARRSSRRTSSSPSAASSWHERLPATGGSGRKAVNRSTRSSSAGLAATGSAASGPTPSRSWSMAFAENYTAAMLEPYLGADGWPTTNRGRRSWSREALKEHATRLDALGFQVHFHALGDRAVRVALDAVEAARSANGMSDTRPHLAHLQLVDPVDVPRFAPLGATANIQPLLGLQRRADDRAHPPVPGTRAARPSSTRSARSFGRARSLAGGSDWTVSTPDVLKEVETRGHPPVRRGPGAASVPARPRRSTPSMPSLRSRSARPT